jgi:uncharacterized protein YdeI (BOF family)
MKAFVLALMFVCVSTMAFAQKPVKPKAASTPKDNAYLGDNPATITDSPGYHRHKRNKISAAASATPASGK